jgi:hypothetical protein
VKAVDEAIEHGVGDVVRVFKADAQTRQRLLPLAIDLGRRERRVAHHVGQHPQTRLEAVLHHHHVQEGQIG